MQRRVREFINEGAPVQFETSEQLQAANFGWQDLDRVVRQVQGHQALYHTDLRWDPLQSIVVQSKAGQFRELPNGRGEGFEKVERELQVDELAQMLDRVWDTSQAVLGQIEQGQVSQVANLWRHAAQVITATTIERSILSKMLVKHIINITRHPFIIMNATYS